MPTKEDGREASGQRREAREETLPLPPTASDVTVGLPSGAVDTPAGWREALAGQGCARYEQGPRLAAGGMGAIVRTRDANIRRHVAMKVMLDPEGASGIDEARFVEEAQVTGQLEHPNIVPVHDLGVDAGGHVFYTMKLVQGTNLRAILTHLREGRAAAIERYPLSELLTVFIKVCDAVAFAHNKGVLHRDLKPANIMVGAFGQVYLMDWGMAKILRAAAVKETPGDETKEAVSSVRTGDDEALMLTMQGTLVGTPYYMSPEQAEGAVDELDERSDIYSLGAILYELLALRPPVEGDTLREILANVKSGAIVDPSTQDGRSPPDRTAANTTGAEPSAPAPPQLPHCPGRRIPPAVAAIAMKALALDPGDRYATVQALQADVERYRAGFATQAEGAGLLRQLGLLVKRHRVFVAAACAVFTALAIGLIVSLKMWRRAEGERQVAQTEKAKAEEAREAAEQAQRAERLAREEESELRRRAEYDAYVGSIALAQRRITEGVHYRAHQILDACPEEFRGWEWHYLKYLASPWIARLPGAGAVRCTHDGRYAATGGDKIHLYDLERERCVAHGAYRANRLAFSLDGRLLSVTLETGVAVLTVPDLQLLWKVDIPTPHDACFTPDGHHVVAACGADVRVMDAQTGTLAWRWQPEKSRWVTQVDVSADGRRMACCGSGQWAGMPAAWVVDTKTQTTVKSFIMAPTTKNCTAVALSPDGMRIACAAYGPGFIADVKTGERLVHLYGSPESMKDLSKELAFDASGDTLLVARDNARVDLLDVNTGACRHTVGGHRGPVLSACLSPDGAFILSAGSNEVLKHRVVETHPDVVVRHDPNLLPTCRHIQVSNEGDIVFGMNWQHPILWFPDNGVVVPLPFDPPSFGSAYHHDSRRLLLGHEKKRVSIWSVDQWKTTVSWQICSEKRAWSVDWSPNGQRIATLAHDGVRLWDVETHACLLTFPVKRAGGFNKVRFSPDGTHLAANGVLADSRTTWLNLQSGQRELSVPVGARNITPCVFAPKEDVVAVACGDTVSLYSTEDFSVGNRLAGHNGDVTALVFSPDGRRVVSGGVDRKVRVWDPKTGRELLCLSGHEARVTGLGFSADGSRLFSCDHGGRLRFWPIKHLPIEAAAEHAFAWGFERLPRAAGPFPLSVADGGRQNVSLCQDPGSASNRCIELFDAVDSEGPDNPHVYMPASVDRGHWLLSVDVRLERDSSLVFGVEDESLRWGPRLRLNGDGSVRVRAEGRPMTGIIPADRWIRVSLRFRPGAGDVGWTARVTCGARQLLMAEELPLHNRAFHRLRRIHAYCPGQTSSSTYLDNIRLVPVD